MNAVRSEVVLVATACIAMGTAVVRIAWTRPDGVLNAPVAVAAAQLCDSVSADSLDAAVESALEADPFRISRARGTVTSAIGSGSQPTAGSIKALRPMLTLKAILGGPPWQAVIEGLPGQAGEVLVSSGSKFADLVVRSISGDGVTLQAPDTTWKLTLKRSTP